MQSPVRRVVILGAAGRDFHDFNTVFRDRPGHQVVAFTATQIPGIDGRRYPAALAGALYPDGIPIVPEDSLEELIRTGEGRPLRLLVLGRRPHAGHAPRVARRRRGSGLPSPRRGPDDAQVEGPRHRRHGRAHGSGKEPDDALPLAHPEGDGPAGRRGPPPDAVRRPRRAGLPALRDLRGPRQGEMHDRGARGVRAAHRQRLRRLRGRRLREDPAPRRGRGRRDPLGRRKQRPAVLRARPPHLHRGSAPARPRDGLPPGRGELPPRRRHPREQVRHRRRGKHPRRRDGRREAEPEGARPARELAGRSATGPSSCAASASSSWRTAPP